MAEVELTIEGNTARLTIDRPDALNALSASVLDALEAHVTMIESDREIHGVIVTGAGRAFVAGADIAELSRLDPAAGLEFARRGQGVFSRIEALEKPIVAAINGVAVAGGSEILQSTDIRIASSKASFGLSEAKRGLVPGGGSMVRLPRQIPYTQAAELLLTAKHIKAPEAKEIGLVGHVVPDGQALERAREIADVICTNGPLAVAAITRTLHECDGMELDEALRHEWSYGQKVFASEDAKEGPLAFAQKRKPEFKGR